MRKPEGFQYKQTKNPRNTRFLRFVFLKMNSKNFVFPAATLLQINAWIVPTSEKSRFLKALLVACWLWIYLDINKTYYFSYILIQKSGLFVCFSTNFISFSCKNPYFYILSLKNSFQYGFSSSKIFFCSDVNACG